MPRQDTVMEDLDHETKDPDQVMSALTEITTDCHRALVVAPHTVFHTPTDQERAERAHREFMRCYQKTEYQFIPKGKSNLAEFVYVAYCHQLCKSDSEAQEWGRGIMGQPLATRFDLLRSFHGLIRCYIREMGMFAYDILPKMHRLYPRIAGIVTYAIQETPNRPQLERDLAMVANPAGLLDNDLLPVLVDLNDMGYATRLSTEQCILAAEEAAAKRKRDLEQDLDNIVTLSNSWEDQMDTVSAFFDHRIPANRGKAAAYKPSVFDLYTFVADCGRLTYWLTLMQRFLARHEGRIFPCTTMKRVNAYSMTQIYKRIVKRAGQIINKSTAMEAQKFYLNFHCPLGARDHFMRTTIGNKDAQNIGTIMAVEMNSAAYSHFMKNLKLNPKEVFDLPEENAKQHESYHAWVWTLWDRILQGSGFQWFRDWMVFPETLVERMNDHKRWECNLSMCMPWRTELRRPMVVYYGGWYFVQAVVRDFPQQDPRDMLDWNDTKLDEAFECFETQDPIEAMACWCDVMYTRHGGFRRKGADLRAMLHEFILNPNDEREADELVENEEEKFHRITTEVWMD